MLVRAWSRMRLTLDDVGADVDDQVAGEGVAEIVETQPSPIAIETRVGGRPTQTRFETLWCKKGVPREVANT